jgi:molybdate transport system substrate-binding protein
MSSRLVVWSVAALAFGLYATVTSAAGVVAAVAANFAKPMEEVTARFKSRTGHDVRLSVGATGTFYRQIVNGAPFDVLLAADAEVPQRLEAEHRSVPGSRFTYAVGHLVLWSADAGRVDAQGKVLSGGQFARIAIASPDVAPYGRAARSVLMKLGLWEAVRPKLVMGENVNQTFSFAATKNADLGFVALSQVKALDPSKAGSMWIVPSDLYEPLVQDAVLLEKGRNNAAARELLDYLRSAEVRAYLRQVGYGTP